MRVALIAGGDAGHTFPSAALTQVLVRRGHDARLLTAQKWLPALREGGVPSEPLPQVRVPNDNPDGVARLYEWAARLAPLVVEQLRDFAPDLVVADVLAVYGTVTAGLLDVPWVQLVPHPLQDPTPFLAPTGMRLPPPRRLVERVRYRRYYELQLPGWEMGRRQLAAARESVGLPPSGPAAARLICSHPALELRRPDWPADARPVGPLEWDPARHDLALPPGDDPLVFLSASTVGGGADDLLGTALEAFDGAGVRLACTRFTPYEKPLPPWAVAGPGRQGPVLDAAAAMVSGAGHGILAKALVRGVPVVAVPGGGEQGENAARLHRARLGVEILPAELTSEALRAAVRAVLTTPVYARRAAACVPPPGSPPQGEVAVDVLEEIHAGARVASG